MDSAKQSRLMPLTDLMPLQPWKTPAPLFPENYQNRQYIKLKKPVVRDGNKVFWQPETLVKRDDEDEYLDVEIPYEGVFEFFDKCIIKRIRVWVDKIYNW
ncbi:hypothetical protein I3843_07G142200 [Carya illinoinensis]|uniref:Uncharacterized protein n=1 Tax=Carya illinoinensis TaxID=32201 RepID=A0A922ENA3_CARIL|nr:hypothetical protein I3760_07G142900 [Carya illinoinensis]KAG6704732.1 hypothetical protein I3842_07G147500 [Carya illinoinensis]KAG7971582.1 hypothetical protein I3843_07G142200 [Carya illinoinensis]